MLSLVMSTIMLLSLFSVTAFGVEESNITQEEIVNITASSYDGTKYSEYLSEYEYKCLARDKAVVMLDSLRKSIGDEKFFASLKRYYRENEHRQTATGDLIASFEKTGVDVGGFFDGFLSGKGIL